MRTTPWKVRDGLGFRAMEGKQYFLQKARMKAKVGKLSLTLTGWHKG